MGKLFQFSGGQHPSSHKKSGTAALSIALPAIIPGGFIGYGASDPSAFLTLPANFSVPTTCNIKGNISYRTGEHIFHVPGQRHYDETQISEGKGERWFCLEAEARAAGWRKSKV